MKKRFGFASLFLSLFLLVTMIGCSGGAAPVEPVVPGNTENTYDFKLVSANADSVTVSWKKDTKSYSDKNHVSVWIVSTDKNETYASSSYDQKKFNLSTSPDILNCTLKDLSPDTEYTIYLIGYDYASYSSTEPDKKICEFSLTAKTAKKNYFSSVYAYAYDGYVSLGWYKATGFSTASKIVISKKTDKEEDFTKVVEVTDSSSYYSDRNFEYETKYTYKFEAFDAEGTLLGSKIETVTTKAMPVPSKITSITATKYIDGWELSWDGKNGDTKYVVGEFTSSSSTEPVRTWEVTEPSFFYSRDITKSTDVYIKIDVYNPKGNSGYGSYKNISSSATASSVSVGVAKKESSQTSVKVTCKDIDVKKAKVEYAVKNSDGSTFLCEYQESKELEVENLPFAAETEVYVYAKITYNTPEGEEKTYETSSASITLKTKSFTAMEKPVVESVTRSSATVSFKLLTEEQLYGVDPSNVRYTVKAYKEGSSYSSISETTTNGTDDSLEITGLTAGTKYQYTVYAYVNGSSDKGDESEKTDAVSTKAALSKPVLTDVVEVLRTDKTEIQTTIKATIPQIEEDEKEEIEYGFKYAFANDSSTSRSASSTATEYTDGEYTCTVNAGNTYYVFAYAQEKGVVSSRVYSEEGKKISLEKINEWGVYNGFGSGDENWFELLNFSDSTKFGGNLPFTTSTFSFNLINGMKTKTNGQKYTVKLSYTSGALEATPYILFVSNYYGTTYGNAPNSFILGNAFAYIVKPVDYLFNGNSLSSITKSSNPKTAGTAVPFDMIYNNSVYIQIQSYDDNYIGFSYRY